MQRGWEREERNRRESEVYCKEWGIVNSQGHREKTIPSHFVLYRYRICARFLYSWTSESFIHCFLQTLSELPVISLLRGASVGRKHTDTFVGSIRNPLIDYGMLPLKLEERPRTLPIANTIVKYGKKVTKQTASWLFLFCVLWDYRQSQWATIILCSNDLRRSEGKNEIRF